MEEQEEEDEEQWTLSRPELLHVISPKLECLCLLLIVIIYILSIAFYISKSHLLLVTIRNFIY